MSENENPNDIVKQTLIENATGAEMPITTRYVVRIIPVPTKMKIPLYRNGAMISESELNELGLTLKSYTRLEVETKEYGDLYERDAMGDGALQKRVRQYKGLLDQLGLSYDSTQDDVMMAIQNAPVDDTTKATLALTMKTVYDAITTNLEYLGSDMPHMDTYEKLAKLIKYLPEESTESGSESSSESQSGEAE